MRTSAVALVTLICLCGCSTPSTPGTCGDGPASANAPLLPFFALQPVEQAARVSSALNTNTPPQVEQGQNARFEDENVSILSIGDASGPAIDVTVREPGDMNETIHAIESAVGIPPPVHNDVDVQLGFVMGTVSQQLPSGDLVAIGIIGSNVGKDPNQLIGNGISVTLTRAADLTHAQPQLSMGSAHDLAQRAVACRWGSGSIDASHLALSQQSLAWAFTFRAQGGYGTIAIDAVTGAVLEVSGPITV